jgi:hypothetical protein
MLRSPALNFSIKTHNTWFFYIKPYTRLTWIITGINGAALPP